MAPNRFLAQPAEIVQIEAIPTDGAGTGRRIKSMGSTVAVRLRISHGAAMERKIERRAGVIAVDRLVATSS